MRKKYLLSVSSWLVLWVCLIQPLYAQQRTVSGKITDNGEDLPGVNIILKGTTNGTVSDSEGNYTIAVSGDNPVLVFSSIGFTTQEVVVGNQTTINVGLIADVQQLSEVVVTALGISRDKK